MHLVLSSPPRAASRGPWAGINIHETGPRRPRSTRPGGSPESAWRPCVTGGHHHDGAPGCALAVRLGRPLHEAAADRRCRFAKGRVPLLRPHRRGPTAVEVHGAVRPRADQLLREVRKADALGPARAPLAAVDRDEDHPAIGGGVHIGAALGDADGGPRVVVEDVVAAWVISGAIVLFLSLEFCLLSEVIFYSKANTIDTIQTVYIKTALPVLWGVSSFILMWMGMRNKQKTLRIISLSLFLLTLLKLFLFDINNIPVAGKIAAFFCLGILLLIISFMYQKVKKIIVDDEAKPKE